MKIHRSFTNNYVAYAVLMQSLLVILQQVLISVFHIPAESTTIYRVVLTAIPLSVAIVITLFRKWKNFLLVYGIIIFVLVLNVIVFPQNEQFLRTLSLRFLLPIVIPSALCLMFVSNVEVAEKALYKISWLTTLLTLFYVVHFLKGTFVISSYNMSFSYALLLPLLSLYSKKNVYSLVAAAFLFITILAIGSRGAAIVFVLYFIYDVFQSNKKKAIIPLVISGQSASSAGGKGAQGKHYGEISKIKQLPKNTAKNWSAKVPFYWSAKTIYAESVLQSMKRMNMEQLLIKLNFEYLYASCLVYDSNYRHQVYNAMRHQNSVLKKKSIKLIKTYFYYTIIWIKRILFHIKHNSILLVPFLLQHKNSIFSKQNILEVATLNDELITKRINLDF